MDGSRGWVGEFWVGKRTHCPSHLKLVYVGYISKTPRLSPGNRFLICGLCESGKKEKQHCFCKRKVFHTQPSHSAIVYGFSTNENLSSKRNV
jgi:hypothetical protein